MTNDSLKGETNTSVAPNPSRRVLDLMLLLAAIAIPIGFYFVYPRIKPHGAPMEVDRPIASFEPSRLGFTHQPLTPPPEFGQLYTNLQMVDSETSEWKDVIASDTRTGRVIRFSHSESGEWNEVVLNQDRELPGPAQITPVDLDQDGDLDFLVSCIGGIQPTNDLVGRVVWLKNDNGEFTTLDLLTNVQRVTDAQPGDFDSDGDLDLVVAVFGGTLQGEILYLENDGNERFTDFELMSISGTIHVPVGDFDNDGDLDFAALVSQEEEAVIAFENPGDGFKNAKRRRIFSSWNFDLGTAGMIATDLDQDGDQDFLLAIGDNLELINNASQPWHGVTWLENKGDWNFEAQQIGKFGGVYGVNASDLDGDGDLDVAAVSIFNDWTQDGAASVVWMENDGQQSFKTWQIADDPIQLATLVCGDLDNDGDQDLVTGSFHFRKPYSKFGSVDAFFNQQGAKQ